MNIPFSAPDVLAFHDVAERANLRQVISMREPALLPFDILKEGLREGGQQLWAIASLLRVK